MARELERSTEMEVEEEGDCTGGVCLLVEDYQDNADRNLS